MNYPQIIYGGLLLGSVLASIVGLLRDDWRWLALAVFGILCASLVGVYADLL